MKVFQHDPDQENRRTVDHDKSKNPAIKLERYSANRFKPAFIRSKYS